MNVYNEVVRLFELAGRDAYFGEPVSQEEHALQCAHLAMTQGAAGWLVVAALLHDVGHLLHGRGEDVADHGCDARHEHIGGAWLQSRFSKRIARVVRLHVTAKQYLCAIDPDYASLLSPASRQSLELQGGPLSPTACAAFTSDPLHYFALKLRRWDDEAKIPGLAVPALDSDRDVICREQPEPG
jgi:phosphonate degradation associated HDIG domain protein